MIYIEYDEENKKVVNAYSEQLHMCNREVSEEIWGSLIKYGKDNLSFDEAGNLSTNLGTAKSHKKKEMCDAFDEEIATGSFESTTLGIEVDCRRTETKNDYQNVVALLSIMQRNDIDSVIYVGASNQTAPATQAQLQALIHEMEDRTIELYNTKWTFKEAISNANDLSDLDKIKIKYKKEKK